MKAALPEVKGRLPPQLTLCLSCKRHSYPAKLCKWCGADVKKLQRKRAKAIKQLQIAAEQIEAFVAKYGPPPPERPRRGR